MTHAKDSFNKDENSQKCTHKNLNPLSDSVCLSHPIGEFSDVALRGLFLSMAKDAYYFSHDSNSRQDPKISALRSKFGWAGYGLFWAIIEVLRDQPDYSYPNGLLYGLALAVGFDNNNPYGPDIKFKDFIDFLIEIGLLIDDGKSIFSQSLINRMNALAEYRSKLSEAGKIGAKKRWGGYGQANGLVCDPNSSKVKESKVKESKKDNTKSSELVDFMNLWNSTCTNLPQVKELSEVRKQKIRLRLKDRPLEAWSLVFKQLGGSDFCCGKNDKGWKATFDWIIENDNNSLKVLEGKYDSRKTQGFSGAGKIPSFRVDSAQIQGNRTATNQVLSKEQQPGNVG